MNTSQDKPIVRAVTKAIEKAEEHAKLNRQMGITPTTEFTYYLYNNYRKYIPYKYLIHTVKEI